MPFAARPAADPSDQNDAPTGRTRAGRWVRNAAPRQTPAVRLVLLGALGLGLLGLAAPAAHSADQVVLLSAGQASAPTATEPAVPHPAAPVPTRASARATRSRPAAPRARAARPPAPRASTRRWVRPVAAPVNSPFGQRWGRPHTGDDFAASYGAPIYAIGDGVVVGAGYQAEEGGYGQITLIRHLGGIVSAYAHQSRMLVHVGEHVTVGQVIGYVGATGHVTGPHLHFEIRTATHSGKIDPRPWLRAHGVIV